MSIRPLVKLHSDLRILTQLQLVVVGFDFVFPLEEGRKKKNNIHLGSSRGCDSTCMKFLVGVWKAFENCLEDVLRVSRGCLKCVWIVSRGYLWCVMCLDLSEG